jgi:hypothetical protein
MSNIVTTPPWSPSNCNLTGPYALLLSPDGSNNTYYLRVNTTANVTHSISQTFTVSASVTPEVIVNFSISVSDYVSYGTYVYLQFLEVVSGDIITAVYNVTTGTVITYSVSNYYNTAIPNSTWDPNSLEVSITPQITGWWLISLSGAKQTTQTQIQVIITPSTTFPGTNFAGIVGNSALMVWDPQFSYTYEVNNSPNVISYQALITSEHNQKPNFMSVVGVIVGAAADSVVAAQNIIPAFNLTTAVGNQLDILGLWIGQSRRIPNVLVTGFFGFSEVSTGNPDGLQEPFGELPNPSIGGIWYNLGQVNSGTTILSDGAYLTILKARIVKNQWNGTLSGIETALQYILGVPCSIADNGTLSLNINIPLPITPLEQALLESIDILPRPAGVAIGTITFAP